MNGFEPKDLEAIAERIRSLIGQQDGDDLGASAARLGVSEASLRASLDVDDPQPTVGVIAAVARYHGVDLSWLLTGEYDVETHRETISDDADIAPRALERLAVRIRTPSGPPPRLPADARPLPEQIGEPLGERVD